jgi:phospholipid/cholesterol/gamma-HCH transport system substrate-binding protein
MELSYKQEVGVGVLVIAGVVLFGGMLFWLTDRDVGGEGVPVRMVLETAAGLEKGDPVMVSGVKKGRVASVTLEKPGRVMVVFNVDADVPPRIDAAVTVGALDFFGAKFVDYKPGERAEPLPADHELMGTRAQELSDLATDLGGRAAELLDSAQAIVNPRLGQDLHNTLVELQRTMRVLTRIGEGPMVTQATKTLAATEQALVRVDSVLAGINTARVDSLTTNLNSLTRSLASSTESLDSILGMMRRGEGSLGRLATDSSLYVNLSHVLASLDSILVDFKLRPGRYLPTVKVF